jgi:hypothetical protein
MPDYHHPPSITTASSFSIDERDAYFLARHAAAVSMALYVCGHLDFETAHRHPPTKMPLLFLSIKLQVDWTTKSQRC